MKKCKYRLCGSDLDTIINLMCLWAQVEPFLKSLLPGQDVDNMTQKLVSGSSMDENLIPFIKDRPPKFSLSLMPSQKRLALDKKEEREQLVCLEVEQQRLEVRDAKMRYFSGALERDTAKLAVIKDLPAKLNAMLHRKRMASLQEQSDTGAKAVTGYAKKNMRVVKILNMQCLQAELVQYRKEVVPWT